MQKYVYLLVLFFALACSSNNERNSVNSGIVSSPIEINTENGNSHYRVGNVVTLTVSHKEIDSASEILIYLDDSLLKTTNEFPVKTSFNTSNLSLGNHRIKVLVSREEKKEIKNFSIIIFNNSPPKYYDYEVVKVFPHDKEAFTQGLYYQDGFLYEGTGQKGESSLRKVNLETGEVIKIHHLEDHVFGEGICLLDDNIYQLSWDSEIGFIYHSSDFQEFDKFYYKGEGWGLTTDGKNIYKSDGSNRLSLHEALTFSEISAIEVFSDEYAIKQLNELEFIDGKIYANIWQKDEIAIINPKSGALEGLIVLKGLLPKQDRSAKTDVLNGIAYDKIGKRLFVTGKNWPKLFEIRLKERKQN